MKKRIFLVIIAIFAFVAASFGQKKENNKRAIGTTLMGINAEYHPFMYDLKGGEAEERDARVLKLDIAGFYIFLDSRHNYSLEWKLVSMFASFENTFKDNESIGAGLLNFALRKETGRFCPVLYLNFREHIIHRDKTQELQHSAALGFEYYLNDYILLCFKAGGAIKEKGYLSPFVGLGIKWDAAW